MNFSLIFDLKVSSFYSNTLCRDRAHVSNIGPTDSMILEADQTWLYPFVIILESQREMPVQKRASPVAGSFSKIYDLQIDLVTMFFWKLSWFLT